MWSEIKHQIEKVNGSKSGEYGMKRKDCIKKKLIQMMICL